MAIDAEEAGSERENCLLLTVDRLSLNDDGAKKNTKTLGMGDRAASIVRRHEALQQIVDLEAPEEMVDQGERAQAVRTEVERT